MCFTYEYNQIFCKLIITIHFIFISSYVTSWEQYHGCTQRWHY